MKEAMLIYYYVDLMSDRSSTSSRPNCQLSYVLTVEDVCMYTSWLDDSFRTPDFYIVW